MVTGSTPISQLPTGTIDALTAVVPMSINMTGTPQTIQASLLQTVTFLGSQGAMISGSYSTLALGLHIVPEGRLTLTSGTSVTASDVIGATTLWYEPHIGNRIALFDGAKWVLTTFQSTNLALGTMVTGTGYDIFAYITGSSVPVLEKTAWTNGATRATAITIQDGRYCKSGDKTRLYLGSICPTSTTQTEDSGGGTSSQVGGKRFVWNMYHRVERPLNVIDTTDSWSYVTGTVRQANGASGNKVEYFCGLNEHQVSADVRSTVFIKNTSRGGKVGVGVDSVTAFSGIVQGSFNNNANAADMPITGMYRGLPGLGYHYLAWLESGGDTTCTFSGDNGADGRQSGLSATVWA